MLFYHLPNNLIDDPIPTNRAHNPSGGCGYPKAQSKGEDTTEEEAASAASDTEAVSQGQEADTTTQAKGENT